MQFGPFNQRDIPRIEPVLQELGIAFTVTEDKELLEQLKAEYQEHSAGVVAKGPSFEPAYIMMEIADGDVPKIGKRLEPYGITEQTADEPDFEVDDFFCPECGTHGIEAGVCPKHHVPLIPSADYKKLQQAEETKGMESTWRLVMLVLGIGVLAWLYRFFF